jgi:TolB-like protein/Tfp pilus assembly protein PilF
VSDLRLAHQRSERIHIRTAPGGSVLSPKLARIVERALDPRPEGRYASAEALAADLAALQRRPVLVRLSYAIAAATALLLIAGLAWEAVGRRVGSSRTPGVWLAGLTGGASTDSPTASPVIAVLPFKNLSVESGSEYFVDGLTIEITRNLAVIQGLKVRSQLSSFDFRDKPRDIGDVGRRLRVNLALEGSVWRSGNTLRVNAQLVQVAGDVVLWSETFDRELKDVFAIQDEISLAIVDRLRLTLGRGQRRYDTSAEAYELFLNGSALLAHRGRDSLEKAAAVFTQVLVKDSEFPPAHAGLAIAYAAMSLLPQAPGGHPIIPVETADAIIRPNAVRALALDPNLADAEAAMGWVHVRDLDWSGAEKAFQRAIALNPSLTHAYTSYSLSTLRPLGKQEDALRLLRVALENDPLSLDVQREIGFVQYEMKRYEDAIHTLQTLRAVEPDFPFADLYLARALVSAGRPTEALALFERIDRLSGRPRRLPDLALAFIALGRRAEAEELAVEHADGGPAAQATIHAALGDKDRAFDALERLAAVDPLSLPRRLVRPEMAVLRGDPRLVSLRQRFRLPPQ